MSGIHSALTYYYDHQAEIDRQIADGRRLAEQMMAEASDSPIQRTMREVGW